MTARTDEKAMAFEVYGLRIGVTADDPSVIARLEGLAPAGARQCDPETVECRIGVTTTEQGRFNVRFDVREGEVLEERDYTAYIAGDSDLDLAIASLDAHVQSYIALHAPEHIFIQAGVVAFKGRAIVLPGAGVTGKSTLVRALVEAGASAYSEDYAPIDAEGRVAPYGRPSVPGAEQHGHTNGHRSAGSLQEGDLDDRPPLAIGAIVLTTFWPGAEWQPRTLSRGEGVLELMARAEPGAERPDESFRAITRALASEPLILQSDRGEARDVAPLILAAVERELPASE